MHTVRAATARFPATGTTQPRNQTEPRNTRNTRKEQIGQWALRLLDHWKAFLSSCRRRLWFRV